MKRRQNKESKGDEDEVGDGIKWRKEGRKTKKKRRMYEDCIGTIDKVHTNAKMNEI